MVYCGLILLAEKRKGLVEEHMGLCFVENPNRAHHKCDKVVIHEDLLLLLVYFLCFVLHYLSSFLIDLYLCKTHFNQSTRGFGVLGFWGFHLRGRRAI